MNNHNSKNTNQNSSTTATKALKHLYTQAQKHLSHTLTAMGSFMAKISNLFSSFGKSKENRILLLGLDGAGKTTLLYKLKLNEFMSTVPTIGFNVEKVYYKNINMTVWDIGGQEHIRRLWNHYYDNSDAVIFIIDSADEERIDLAKEELKAVMSSPELENAQLLVYANKMDIARMSVAEIASKLELSKYKNSWQIQGCSAVTGDGLYEGMEWLSKELKKAKKN